MKTQRTYTFEPSYNRPHAWRPRITVECGRSRPIRYYPTEASYRRFVALANSGQYKLTIEANEGVSWILSRKPQLSFVLQLDWPQRQQA